MRSRRRRPRVPWTLTRRKWLQGVGALGGIFTLPGCDVGAEEEGGCNIQERPDVKLPPGDWIRGARVAGLASFADAQVCDFGAELDAMADARVTVVEVDSELSSYLDEAGFVEQLRVCDLVARECHQRGMRCIAYYPVLEALSAEAETSPRTMAKEHPDWLQIGIDGKPNSFIGGQGRVFWVAPGEESSWLCPTSGYVDYFNQRVARLAGTALDGFWGDVPLLSDIVGVYPCTNDTCKARFKAETGFDTPTVENYSDPIFMRWIAWRHQLIWDLEQNIVEAVKRIRPDFECIIETVTMDYSAGTVQGLDGAFRDDGRIYRVWEVDVVSDNSAMREASENDWYSIAVMMKHARGCSEPRPAWTFCYGKEEADAERVMAICIATGASPYETKIPEINTTVGYPYRKKMYSWLEQHPQILLSRSVNEVAVLYSSAARDWLDRADGVGLYTSINPNDPLWWSDQDDDWATDTTYVADYRGFCKFLIQSHAPFDVVVMPHADAPTLARYKTIFAPSLAGIAQDKMDVLQAWIDNGGQLVLTGPEAGLVDDVAVKRAGPALVERFALDPGVAGWSTKAIGAGRIAFTPDRAGREYFRGNTQIIPTVVDQMIPDLLVTDAPPGVLMEKRLADSGELVVCMANLEGLGSQGVGSFTPRDASFSCAVNIPAGKTATKVVLTEPGAPDREVPVAYEGNRVRFSVALKSAMAAIITLA